MRTITDENWSLITLLGWITWSIARLFLMKSRFISLVNIAADRLLIDEYVQTRVQPDLLSQAVSRYLDDTDLREKTSHILQQQTQTMKGQEEAPSEKAARAILSILTS